MQDKILRTKNIIQAFTMSETIKLRRGLDLKLEGGLPSDVSASEVKIKVAALIPDDFPGFIPKLCVREGDEIAAGAPLMHDKINEPIVIASPVSGRVKAVVRGERRKILRVEVEPSDAPAAKAPTFNINPGADAAAIRNLLMQSGLWAFMRQRPYDIVPQPDATPVNIFVTAFDSAPLSPSLAKAVGGKEKEITAGLQALTKLTDGSVYLSVRPGEQFSTPAGVETRIIDGPHPAGNAGIQAANIAPVNKGQTIWTLDIVTVARIGSLMLNGHVDWSTEVALVGSDVKTPKLVKTIIGAEIRPIISGDIADNSHHCRIIAGNVLTGIKESADGYLHFPYRQITVIPEGDDVDEFMGWASMSPKKMSVSRSFLSSLIPGKKFAPDARLNGGRRAMIMSEQYDKVMPMDILPEYLIKAILARDIDQMERLGIYEVAPEDFALCELVDPSKLELQKTVREGLDYLRKELQ